MTTDAGAAPPTEVLRLRSIEAADIASLFEVRIRTRENRYTREQLAALGITPASVAQWIAGARQGWLCEADGRTVGFCMADRETGELLVIAVLPGYEGRGIGDALLDRAERWLWSHGCDRAWLTTDRDTALRAYGFYRRRGWTDWKQADGLRWMERVRPPAVPAPPGDGLPLRVQAAAPGFDDFSRVLALLREAFAFMQGRIDPPSSLDAMTETDLREKALRERLLLAWLDGRLVGCVFAAPRPDAVYVGKLAVAADVRGRGVARRLILAAESFARETGRPLLELQTRVELVENQRTFESLGFRIVAHTAHAGYERPTSVTMQRPVPPPLRLVRPAREHLQAYVAALRQGWSADTMRGPEAAAEELALIEADADAFLASMEDREALGPPVTLPDGRQVPRLPGFRRWMWDDGFCGSINLRWQPGTAELPPHCLGHIGYAVVPWRRGRGVARAALAALLPEAWAVGLPHVHITTDVDNRISQRVIEACGGVLIERFTMPEAFGAATGLRYRIVRPAGVAAAAVEPAADDPGTR